MSCPNQSGQQPANDKSEKSVIGTSSQGFTMTSTQDSECEGSNGTLDKKNTSDKRTKRHLSPTEEVVLLACLKEFIANGWKSDNEFRAGYLSKLEELMRKELPGTDLKGIPDIHSKIQTWKKNYNSLNSMLALSGIGFKDHMVDCSTDQWEQIVMMDSNAKPMHNRKWPMYDAWKEIFGKDRATRENTEDILDAVNDLLKEETRAMNANTNDYYVNVEHLNENNAGESSVCGSGNDLRKTSVGDGSRSESNTKGSGKKRKIKESNDSVVDVLCEIGRNTNARLESLVQCIGYESEMDEAKKNTFGLVNGIEGLTLYEKFDLCEIFAANTQRLLIFQGLPDSAKPHYLLRLLKK